MTFADVVGIGKVHFSASAISEHDCVMLRNWSVSLCCRSTQAGSYSAWSEDIAVSSKGLFHYDRVLSVSIKLSNVKLDSLGESRLQDSLAIRSKNWSQPTFTFVMVELNFGKYR